MAVPPSFDYLSLFSGIGGLDLGLRLALPAARCLGYVEGEAFAASVLAARMEAGALDAAPVWSDVRSFPSALYRGRIRMVIGGFPCQDLSVAGRRAGIHGARSSLYFDLLRVAREVGCEYLFLENVSGVFVRGVFELVLGALAEDGWDAEWLRLRASDVGAPHRRERWFCLARRCVDNPVSDRRYDDGTAATFTEGDRPNNGLPVSAGVDVANAGGERRQQDTGSPPRNEGADGWQPNGHRQPSGADAGMADPTSEPDDRRRRPGENGRSESSDRRLRVADTSSGTPEEGRGAIPREAASRGPHTRPSGPGVLLADPGSGEHNRRAPEPFRREEWGTAHQGSGADRDLFPPGPADTGAWHAILRGSPDYAPAIESTVRGVVDGFPERMDNPGPLFLRTDRLRALGNSVVPVQAGVAFSTLWRRLHWSD